MKEMQHGDDNSADTARPGSVPAAPPGTPPQNARVFELLYTELRQLAQSELRGERRAHTLSATALVNEAYLKLGGAASAGSTALERGRFFALAAVAMRHILIDYARMRSREKRGGGVLLRDVADAADLPAAGSGKPLDALVLDEALTRLALEHPDAARVVEMRFFGGLPELTIAQALGVNDRTVRRHWTFAKAWLARELAHTPNPPAGDG